MDSNEVIFYQELARIGVNSDILELLPFKPWQILPGDNDGYILESPSGKLALWIHRGREASLAYLMVMLKICQQQGLKGFLYPLPLNDGRTYATWDLQSWFYVTPWPESEKVYFSRSTNLQLIVKLLIEFRKTMLVNGFLFCLPERMLSLNLLEKYHDIVRQLNSFALLARHRLRPTAFDREYISYLPVILDQADQAIHRLEKTKYLTLIAGLTSHDVVINKLTRHNFRVGPDNRLICLRLDNYYWDLPIIDIATLLIKTGRSAKWDANWFDLIIKEYEKHFVISEAELQVIQAYLVFPWSFYRLAARYYYNRVDWPLLTLVEKMERLLADEVNRVKFLKNF